MLGRIFGTGEREAERYVTLRYVTEGCLLTADCVSEIGQNLGSEGSRGIVGYLLNFLYEKSEGEAT